MAIIFGSGIDNIKISYLSGPLLENAIVALFDYG